jgi:signal transduction histidine kinase
MNGLADYQPRTATVLIVDDTPANLGLIVETLGERGFRVLIALDGAEAIERAKYCLPDLVLLDVNMPGVNGFETCRLLKTDERTRDIPVIFMTVADGVSDMVEGFRVGGVDYVTKPVRIDEVVARMDVHLTMREMQKTLVKQNRQLQQEVCVRQKAEHELSRIRDELELRVAARTSELARANDDLRAEIAVRQRAEAELKLSEAVLLESREQLRQLSAHMEAIREEERKRIALEIHDELGQLLTALKMDVSLLKMRLSDAPDLLKKVSDMRELVELTILMVRNVANHLRPAALNFGLISALEWLAEDFIKRTGISCQLLANGCEPIVNDSHATAVFRVVQESLTNVVRHAGATRVHVTVVCSEGALQVHVSDNGCGFEPAAVAKRDSYGLLGISERARLIGASLQIDSAPGCGTVISIGIPAKNGSEHDQDPHRG